MIFDEHLYEHNFSFWLNNEDYAILLCMSSWTSTDASLFCFYPIFLCLIDWERFHTRWVLVHKQRAIFNIWIFWRFRLMFLSDHITIIFVKKSNYLYTFLYYSLGNTSEGLLSVAQDCITTGCPRLHFPSVRRVVRRRFVLLMISNSR